MIRSTVSLILNAQSQILLLKRSEDCKIFPGEWCLPGGKIDFISSSEAPFYSASRWEEPEETAFRETYEETGILMRSFYKCDVILCDSTHLVYPFQSYAQHSDLEITTKFPNKEHSDYAWFRKDELPEDLGKMTKDLLYNLKF